MATMLSEKMQKEINKQINAETYSAYLYLSMGAWFASKNLMGFASWMKVQAQEEMSHAMKFYNHVVDRAGVVKLTAIEQPPLTWETPLDVFKAVAKHEQHVTALINNLVSLARDEKDFASDNFLQWYVSEQVEEEASADAVIHKLDLIGNDKSGLFLVDQELATRTFAYPGAALAAPGAAA